MTTAVRDPKTSHRTSRPWLTLAVVTHLLVSLTMFAAAGYAVVRMDVPTSPGVQRLVPLTLLAGVAGALGAVWLIGAVGLALRRTWARWLLIGLSALLLLPAAFVLLTVHTAAMTIADVSVFAMSMVALVAPCVTVVLPGVGRELRT